ncbi:MAG: flagellin lysine-N-methylase [Clostridia bacterium]|nr:flagellin lysine-N-methylase [Clostridia bacterium]
MKKIGLSCFEGFVCKAGDCKDNCCIGWEIDIDEATLEKYKSYKGALKERFEKDICYDETPHFILGEHDRCPFLNKDGLCDIILDSGEGMLCEICDKHPRFYEWLPGITFEGYGIGCEKAAEMLLEYDKPISFTETIITDEDGEEEPDDMCGIVLSALNVAKSILQNRDAAFPYRLMTLLAFGSSIQNAVEGGDFDVIDHILTLYSNKDYIEEKYEGYMRFESENSEQAHKEIVKIFRSLESLDERWHKHLLLMLDYYDVVLRAAAEEFNPQIWENMAIYFLFRHLPAAYHDEDFLSRIKFVIMSFLTNGLLMRIYDQERIVDKAVMYSKEIEYSDENVSILLDKSYTEDCLSVQSLMSILVSLCDIQ